jgi:hypothetical protein
MTDIVDWLRQCATNEPNNSDAESLWAAGDLITFLRSSLKEIREENDRLKGEIERLESLHRSEIADMAERFRSVNLSAALDLMPDNSALVVRAERAESSCEAMAKALEPLAEEAARYEPPEGDDDRLAWRTDLVIGDLRRARTLIAEYRKEKTP